jgi:hypothetical protein
VDACAHAHGRSGSQTDGSERAPFGRGHAGIVTENWGGRPWAQAGFAFLPLLFHLTLFQKFKFCNLKTLNGIVNDFQQKETSIIKL